MLYHMCISVHVSSAGGPEKHIFNYCPSPVALIGTPCRTAASLLRSPWWISSHCLSVPLIVSYGDAQAE